MSIIKSLFKSKFSKEEEDGIIKPKLNVGDIIDFSFNEISELSNEDAEVTSVRTLELSETERIALYKIRTGEGVFTLKFIESREEDQLEIWTRVYPDEVLNFFDESDFISVLNESGTSIDVIHTPKEYNEFLSNSYSQRRVQQAYIYKGDYSVSELPDKGYTEVDYVFLKSNDGKNTLNMFIEDSGDTSVYLGKITPLRIIENILKTKEK